MSVFIFKHRKHKDDRINDHMIQIVPLKYFVLGRRVGRVHIAAERNECFTVKVLHLMNVADACSEGDDAEPCGFVLQVFSAASCGS